MSSINKFDGVKPQKKIIKCDNLIAVTLGCMLMLAALSRGFFELYTDKSLAYAIQVAFIVFWFTAAMARNWITFSIQSVRVNFFLGLALFTASISSVLTYLLTQFIGSFFYFGVFIVVASFLYIGGAMQLGKNGLSVIYCIAVAVVALVLVAVAQQFGFYAELPGMSWVYGGGIRPSSLTGSMLHYPIIVSSLALVLFDIGSRYKLKSFLFIASLTFIAIITTFSRSGFLIFSCAFVFIVLRFRKAIILPLLFVTSLIISGLLSLFYFNADLAEGYMDRVVNMASMQDEGNLGRVDSWDTAIKRISKGPVFISTETGVHTNATVNFGFMESGIVSESSVLLLVLNFGLITAFMVYATLLHYVFESHLSNISRASILGVLLQSFFYQSLEVLPFVFAITIILIVGKLPLVKSRQVD